MGLLWHCLPLDLLETHRLDTLPTCSHSSQLEIKKMGADTRGEEGEIRGIGESSEEGWMKQHGGVTKREKEQWVERKMLNTGKYGNEEQDDKDEEGRKKGSPDGPAEVLEELRLDVGEEEVGFTGGGGGEELSAGISGRFGASESVSVTPSSNGSA